MRPHLRQQRGGSEERDFQRPQPVPPEGALAPLHLHTFIASENERVQVTFMSFNLRGTNPECNQEYIDLYTEIEDATMELIRTPFGGRYCGRNRPRNRISMYQTLVIAFYTAEESVTPDAFEGYYEFINASQYVVGTAAPDSVCSFTVFSDNKSEGEFRSPTYPESTPRTYTATTGSWERRDRGSGSSSWTSTSFSGSTVSPPSLPYPFMFCILMNYMVL
ncbi:hypothetical protein CEXT_275041 [Caerostris extrusa]|uniref:CUB domain-containing protein n=1 Tax=Caerostris extrusa TaxID=172846 RepID=A0AAV4UWI3_CAEEX|nr:hypothetical protein CEXT_275041 [Caerostris extrusa]